jgi:hypothetical protein
MAVITNFDELKRKHDRARIATVGSKAWLDFVTTMIDSFPALYKTAKAMNEHFKEITGNHLDGFGEATPLPPNTSIFIAVSHIDEYGEVYLNDYMGTSRHAVEQLIMAVAKKDGFNGDLNTRMTELNWEIVEYKLTRV